MDKEDALSRWESRWEEEKTGGVCCEEENGDDETLLESAIYRIVTRAERRLLTPESAALILFAVFIFGIISTFVVLTVPPPVFLEKEPVPGPVAGYAWTLEGDPMSGVSMRLHGVDTYTSTNEQGFFLFHEAPPGEYELSASADGYSSAIYVITVDGNKPTMYHFTMKPGFGTEYDDLTGPSPPPSFFSMQFFLASLFLFGSFCALFASILSFRRKKFKLALALAGFGVLSYGFIAGAIMSAIATGFIMAEKHCFDCEKIGEKRPKKLRCGSCGVELVKCDQYLECACGRVYHYECALQSTCSNCGQEFRDCNPPR